MRVEGRKAKQSRAVALGASATSKPASDGAKATSTGAKTILR